VEFARPLVHDATVLRLWAAARAGRLPHGLLFEGRAGIGKFAAAKWFAAGCLCARGPGEPCGSCGPCRRVASGGAEANHPDLFVIDPLAEEEEQIKVGRIAARGSDEDAGGRASLEAFLGLRAHEAKLRPVLVRESHRMNVAAQNALLKTLEEPRPGTVLVLETHKSAGLLATIKSRCIRIRFDAPTHAQCVEVLLRAGLAGEEARVLARLADGAPGVALALARSGAPAIVACVARVARGERPPQAAAQELWELEGEFPGRTEAARDRARARVALDCTQRLVREALHAAVGVALGARLGERELVRRARALATIRADVDRNLGAASALERALLVLTAD
jgi:DNA polymerase-3 subunit delta'